MNESSGLKYCNSHAMAKGFKIWLDKEHTKFGKLVLIKSKPFSMGDLWMNMKREIVLQALNKMYKERNKENELTPIHKRYAKERCKNLIDVFNYEGFLLITFNIK